MIAIGVRWWSIFQPDVLLSVRVSVSVYECVCVYVFEGLRVCALLFQLLITCENKTNRTKMNETPKQNTNESQHSIHMKIVHTIHK